MKSVIVLGSIFLISYVKPSPYRRKVDFRNFSSHIGESKDVFIAVNHNKKTGRSEKVCMIDGINYRDGDAVPTSNQCEFCICRPPGFACSFLQCAPPRNKGCRVLKKTGTCCPEYLCDCEKDGKMYKSGQKIIDPKNPCDVCFCQGGDLLCSKIHCFVRDDCKGSHVPGRCCPSYDECENTQTGLSRPRPFNFSAPVTHQSFFPTPTTRPMMISTTSVSVEIVSSSENSLEESTNFDKDDNKDTHELNVDKEKVIAENTEEEALHLDSLAGIPPVETIHENVNKEGENILENTEEALLLGSQDGSPTVETTQSDQPDIQITKEYENVNKEGENILENTEEALLLGSLDGSPTVETTQSDQPDIQTTEEYLQTHTSFNITDDLSTVSDSVSSQILEDSDGAFTTEEPKVEIDSNPVTPKEEGSTNIPKEFPTDIPQPGSASLGSDLVTDFGQMTTESALNLLELNYPFFFDTYGNAWHWGDDENLDAMDHSIASGDQSVPSVVVSAINTNFDQSSIAGADALNDPEDFSTMEELSVTERGMIQGSGFTEVGMIEGSGFTEGPGLIEGSGVDVISIEEFDLENDNGLIEGSGETEENLIEGSALIEDSGIDEGSGLTEENEIMKVFNWTAENVLVEGSGLKSENGMIWGFDVTEDKNMVEGSGIRGSDSEMVLNDQAGSVMMEGSGMIELNDILDGSGLVEWSGTIEGSGMTEGANEQVPIESSGNGYVDTNELLSQSLPSKSMNTTQVIVHSDTYEDLFGLSYPNFLSSSPAPPAMIHHEPSEEKYDLVDHVTDVIVAFNDSENSSAKSDTTDEIEHEEFGTTHPDINSLESSAGISTQFPSSENSSERSDTTDEIEHEKLGTTYPINNSLESSAGISTRFPSPVDLATREATPNYSVDTFTLSNYSEGPVWDESDSFKQLQQGDLSDEDEFTSHPATLSEEATTERPGDQNTLGETEHPSNTAEEQTEASSIIIDLGIDPVDVENVQDLHDSIVSMVEESGAVELDLGIDVPEVTVTTENEAEMEAEVTTAVIVQSTDAATLDDVQDQTSYVSELSLFESEVTNVQELHDSIVLIDETGAVVLDLGIDVPEVTVTPENEAEMEAEVTTTKLVQSRDAATLDDVEDRTSSVSELSLFKGDVTTQSTETRTETAGTETTVINSDEPLSDATSRLPQQVQKSSSRNKTTDMKSYQPADGTGVITKTIVKKKLLRKHEMDYTNLPFMLKELNRLLRSIR